MPGTPIALTIAGSDSGGGAGIQADLKTFAALGVYGASVVTALTAQNTLGVRAIHLAPPEIVAAQIDAVLEDFDVAAIKIGMLGMAEIVEVVAERLRNSLSSGSGGDEGSRDGRARRSALGHSPAAFRAYLSEQKGVAARYASEAPFHRLRSRHGRFVRRCARAAAGFVEAVRRELLPLVDCLTPNLAEAAALLGEADRPKAKPTWRARARRC